MGITPCSIHDQATLVGTHSFGESFGTLLDDDVPPPRSAGHRGVDLLASIVVDLGNRYLSFEFWLANLALDLAAVHGKISEVCEELLGTVLGANEVEESRGIVNEGCPALSVDKGGVCEELNEKRYIRLSLLAGGGPENWYLDPMYLDAADTEFNQCTKHLAPDNLVCGTTARAFHLYDVSTLRMTGRVLRANIES
jgi:hypothetical protein